MTDEDQIKAKLRDWIADKSGAITADEVTGDLALIERRILTSLQVVEMIRFIQRLRKRPIDVSMINPRSFRDLDTIVATFFDGPS